MTDHKDGIRYPAIDELNGKTESKYKLVVAVAHRAKEIEKDNETFLEESERHNVKPIGLALEEIVQDKIIVK